MAIRGLVEAYAQAADLPDGDAMAELFLPDGLMFVYRDPMKPAESSLRSGRAEISAVGELLKQNISTMHVIANHTATVTGDAARAKTRCLAHHLNGIGADRRDLVMHIEYDDLLVRTPDGWFFAERHIHVVALDDRPAPT